MNAEFEFGAAKSDIVYVRPVDVSDLPKDVQDHGL